MTLLTPGYAVSRSQTAWSTLVTVSSALHNPTASNRMRGHSLVLGRKAAPPETVLGEYDDDLDQSDFISFLWELDGKYSIKLLIDTGGKANLVARKWLENHEICIPDIATAETTKFINANRRISDLLSIIRMDWKFDDSTVWKWVKFIATDHGPDALLGLPFLKHTQIIHSSKDRFLFPEFEELASSSTNLS